MIRSINIKVTLTWRMMVIYLLKNSVSSFNEISSIDSKFDEINKFYKDFKKLRCAKSKNDKTKQKKITVLKNALLLYDEVISIYITRF